MYLLTDCCIFVLQDNNYFRMLLFLSGKSMCLMNRMSLRLDKYMQNQHMYMIAGG
jgi:hypothetical protein